MSSILPLQILVWVSYIYIVTVYTYRTVKCARMPMHLRWELYPLPHEKGYEHGGSYFEESEWWTKPRQRHLIKDILYMVKDYLFFFQYYTRNRGYWSVLYIWHISFYLIVGFHIVVAIGALALIADVEVSADASVGGAILHYVALVSGIGAFCIGVIGSIAMLIKRLIDPDLRIFATPRHYFSYVFYLGVFLSGLIAWAFFDTDFATYREFYESVLTLGAADVDPALVVHAVFFALFLFYMPFTKALHYTTKLIAFFAIRWNDIPNLRGSDMEKKIEKLVGHPMSWAAPHIQTGKTWGEVVTQVPNED